MYITKTRDYWLAKHYGFILINGVETLIYRVCMNINMISLSFKIYVMA